MSASIGLFQSHVSKPTKFVYMLPDDNAIYHVLPVLWITSLLYIMFKVVSWAKSMIASFSACNCWKTGNDSIISSNYVTILVIMDMSWKSASIAY